MIRNLALFVVVLAFSGCGQQADRSASLRSPELLDFRFASAESNDETTSLPLMSGSGTINVLPESITTGKHVPQIDLKFPTDRSSKRAYLIFHLDQDAMAAIQNAKDASDHELLAIVFDGKIISSSGMPETVTSYLSLETDTQHASDMFDALTSH